MAAESLDIGSCIRRDIGGVTNAALERSQVGWASWESHRRLRGVRDA